MWVEPGRVLYQGRAVAGREEICVTETWCVVNGSRYPIEELNLLGVTRGTRDALHARKIVWVVAVAVALLLVIVAIRSGWTRQAWPAVAVAVVGTAAITAIPAALGRVLRRPYEIWAEFHGAEVRLFATEDREQYGQVARALVRARESHGQ